MDWSKAKNILIVALIITNLFLLFMYLEKNGEEQGIQGSKELSRMLESNNIHLKTEIPKQPEKTRVLELIYGSLEEGQVAGLLADSQYSVGKGSLEDLKEKYIESASNLTKACFGNIDLAYTSVAPVKASEEEGNLVEVRFIQECEGIAIAGNPIVVTYKDGRPVDITRRYISSWEKSKKGVEVMTPEEALLIFISQKGEGKIDVEKMNLVYWVGDSDIIGKGQQENSFVSDTAFPAWRISYNGGKVKIIEAMKA